MTQLRQAGYDGPVLGNWGASAGNLKPAGADGAGMVWAADFHPEQDIASSQDFVKAYKAEYNEDPLNYAAEAYDAAWFLARSIKEAGSADRAHQGRHGPIAAKPFTGALGEDLTWKDGTSRSPASAVQWTGTDEKLLVATDAAR